LSEQEAFWKGTFGDCYTVRNRVDWKKRKSFWELILGMTGANSVLEVGCNAGWNLKAIREVDSRVELRGVDLNAQALAEARADGFDVRARNGLDVGKMWPARFDLVATVGCLIHVPTRDLPPITKSIVAASKHYVLAVEYASEDEQEVTYRGHNERLWRRPFGGVYEKLGLRLVETGVLAEGDGFDDCTFWLLTKQGLAT
jgi:pseudaminic acid biosynthesis-associated methylase